MKRGVVLFLIVIIYFFPNTSLTHVYAATSEQKDMQVHFINVGQGDSILIQTPDNKNILIDGGPPSSGAKLVSYLKEKSIETIDTIISTHPDIDHIGGLIPVVKTFKVKEIIDSGKFYYTKTYFEYVKQIEKMDIPVRVANIDKTLQVGDNISIQYLNESSIFKTNNQSSLALKLTYGKVDFLLMSDVGKKQEMRIADNYNLKAEILKVAHHGSDTSSALPFLQKVQPEKAIISYSKDNHFGHPVPSTIDNLLQVGATIYSTAKAGDIIVTTNGKTYHLEVSGTGRLVQRNIS